jgi:putative endonuclease
MYTCYILRSKSSERYYVGSTEDLINRLREHNAGEGKSTRAGVPWEIIWTEEFATRAEAVRRERQVKARGIRRFLDDQNLAQPD